MKKLSIFLLALLALFSLSACKDTEDDKTAGSEVVTEGEGEEAQTYVVANFSAEDYTKFSGAVNELGYLGFDIYYTQTTCGVGSDSYTSVYFTWPTAE